MSQQNTEFPKIPERTDKYAQLLPHLLRSSSWLMNETRQFLQPFQLTPKQYVILRILAESNQESLSIQEVREALVEKMSDASRLIERLEKKGLLRKSPSLTDRRSSRVSISPQGASLLHQVEKRRTEIDDLIVDRLKPEEIDRLMELLRRLQ